MEKVVDGFNFFEMEAERYFAPPSSWSQEKKEEWATQRIFSGEWYGAQKRDGAFFMFLKDEDGNMYLRPRTRNVKKEFVNKINWVPHLKFFFDSIPNGTCFLGELYLTSTEEAKATTSIMNCLQEKAIKRQEKNPLIYYIFDVLAYDGENFLDATAEKRFALIKDLDKYWGIEFFDKPFYVEWADYCTGKELWNNIQKILADGYEGVVITRGDSHYLPGKRTNKDTLKIKKELQETIDCVIIGANPPTKIFNGKEIQDWTYWFDERNNEKVNKQLYKEYVDGAAVIPVTKNWFYGWAGSLKLGLYDGDNLVHIGNLSGITEEIKENWKDYVGAVVEIMAMEIMDNAQGGVGLRHPKLKGFRTDKSPKECVISQIK